MHSCPAPTNSTMISAAPSGCPEFNVTFELGGFPSVYVNLIQVRCDGLSQVHRVLLSGFLLLHVGEAV